MNSHFIYKRKLFTLLTVFVCIMQVFFAQKRIVIIKDQIHNSIKEEEKISLIIKLSEEYRQINPDSALSYADAALQNANLINNKKLATDAELAKASLTAIKGNYQEGLLMASRALEYYNEKNDKTGKLNAYHTLGLIYMFSADYPRAIDYQFKALNIAENTSNIEKQAIILSNIGFVHLLQGDYEKALKYIDQTLSLNETEKVEEVKALAYANKGIISAVKNDFANAMKYYNISINKAVKYENKNILQTAYINIAHLHTHLGDIEKAEIYYKKALLIQIELGQSKFISSSYKGLGDIFLKKNQLEKALQHYKLADSIAYKYIYPEIRTGVLLSKAEIYQKQNRLPEAYNTMLNYTKLKDSLNITNSNKQIAQIQANYDLEKKDQEILTLSQQKKIDEKKIALQLKFIVLLSVSFFIIGFVILLLLLQKRKKEHAYNVLLKKNIEIMDYEKLNFSEPVNAKNIDAITADIADIADIKNLDDKKLNENDFEQESRLINKSEDELQIVKYEKSNLAEEQKDRLLSAIQLLMNNEKPYLNPDFNIDKIAEMLGVYKKHISQVINEKLGTNFISYVNDCRVHTSKQMLVDIKFANYTIEAIGNEAGFHSKSSFNSAFKKNTGLTPSFFRENILKKTQ